MRQIQTVLMAMLFVNASAFAVMAAMSDITPLAEKSYFAKSHALIIGIDQYSNGWEPLHQAVEDARKIEKALKRHGFSTQLVVNPDFLTLRDSIENFVYKKGADREARLFIWFAGHGHTLDGEGYLVPRGAKGPETDWKFRQGALSLRRFGEYMREAKSRHVLTIFDSCFSGSVFTSVRGIRRRDRLPPKISLSIENNVRQMISSGTGAQVVSDNGKFADLFLQALAGQSLLSGENDRYLLASRLGSFLNEKITNDTNKRQTPRHGKLDDARYNQGDFVFRILPNGGTAPQYASGDPPSTEADPSFFEQLVARVSREGRGLARQPLAALGAALLFALPVWFLWVWRNVRLLRQLKPGTPGMAEEVEKARSTLLSPGRYRDRLKGWLDWLSDKFQDDHPWSAGAYDWMLRLAVIYPIAGIFLVWLATGENTSGIEGLLPIVDLLQRLLVVGGLLVLMTGLYQFNRIEGWRSIFWLAVAIAGAGAFAGAGAGVFIGAVAGAFAVAGAGVFVGAGTGTVVVAVAVAVAGAFSLSLTLAVAGAVAVAGAFALTLAVAVAGAFALAGAGALLYFHETLTHRGYASIAHSVSWLVLSAACVALAFYAGPLKLHDGSRSLLVFLAVLPLVNVIFDWFSLGLTRHLLAETVRGKNPLRNGVVDLVAAILVLLVLAVVLTASLQGLNMLAYRGGADQPLIDLAGVLKTLRERPGDPGVWWIYFMLFSTLLPSLIHLFIAAASLITWGLSENRLSRYREDLRKGWQDHPQQLHRAARFMTLKQMSAVVIVGLALGGLVLTGWGLRLGLPQLASTLLTVSEATAASLGAPVSLARKP